MNEWIDKFGIDGVYISFSGGKDSTVLLDIARKLYPKIKAVYVDTGLEFPEIKEFVKTFENVDIIRPKMTFKQVIEKYGYPIFSKEISECVYQSRRYLDKSIEKYGLEREREDYPRHKDIPYWYRLDKIHGTGKYSNNNKIELDRSMFSNSKYSFMLSAPFEIGNGCCKVMKKNPLHTYSKKYNRKPITAQMASESVLRTQQYLKNGCNGFDMKNPVSNPMGFWTEQDVLLYIYLNKLPIAKVYGEVISDKKCNSCDIELFDLNNPYLYTTGYNRTGCMFCAYGIHLEKEPNRFQKLQQTHNKIYEYICKSETNGGLGLKEKIDWINNNSNFNINLRGIKNE